MPRNQAQTLTDVRGPTRLYRKGLHPMPFPNPIDPAILFKILDLRNELKRGEGWTGSLREGEQPEQSIAHIEGADFGVAAKGFIAKFRFKQTAEQSATTEIAGRGVPNHETVHIDGQKASNVDIVISPRVRNGSTISRVVVEYKLDGGNKLYRFEKTLA